MCGNNIAGEPLDAIMVTVTFEDAARRLVKTSEAVVSPNPLESGQVGDFKVIERADPRFDHYKVSFHKFAGAAIPHRGPK
jgi:hypothetical protein